jgi:hypothetical protein
MDNLGRPTVFVGNQPLSENDLRTWLFWAEAEFLPRSYVSFLDHSNSWAITHRRWKEQGVEYSWHSKINWPVEFERETIATFEKLKAKHSGLVGKLI